LKKASGRVLGIDYGAKRIGVAISDPTRLIAQPVATLQNDISFKDRLLSLTNEREVTLIVVGMPYAPDGGAGSMAQQVLSFIELLQSWTTVPIVTWDESNSSTTAEAILSVGGMKRKQRRSKGSIDVMAARVMLQEFLDQSMHPDDY